MMKSLASRLTSWIMAVVLVIMVVITGFLYFTVRNYMQTEAEGRYRGLLDKTYEEYRRRLSDVYVAVSNNVHDLERDIEHPELMATHLERIVSMNHGMVSCRLLWKDSLHKYPQSEWVHDFLEHDSSGWVETATYATPLHNGQDEAVAMLCGGLSLTTMRQELIKDVRKINEKYEKGLPHQSYCFVIDHEGTYVVHPDDSRMLNDSYKKRAEMTADMQDDRVVASMVKGENGQAMLEVDGVPSWIYYSTIKYIDWTIAIVVPRDVILHNGRMLNTIIVLTMLLGLIAIYFICHRMIRKITKPLHRFAMSADEVAMGNFASPLPDIQGSDEVRLLHDAFKNMQTSLSAYVDELRKTTSDKASLERELKIAHDIQMAMLPKSSKLEQTITPAQPADCHHGENGQPRPQQDEGRLKPYDLHATLEPALDVGGDLYDYYLRNDRLFFCIGDVSGKGIPAALMMAVMRAMFRSETRRADTAVAIVETMNRNLSEEYTAGYFVTMFVGILDLKTGLLDYCNAGSEAPLVINARCSGLSVQRSALRDICPASSGKDDQRSTVHTLPIKPNLPVGALSDWNYEGQQAELKPGDMLFFYTDGLTEAKNSVGKQLGRQHVLQLAGKYTGDTARQLVQLMEEEVHRHASDTGQSDDITLLAIKWNNGQRSLANTLSMQSSMSQIDRLKPYIEGVTQQAGIDSRESKRLRLAVEEAVANVINYSQATTITLQASKAEGQLMLTIDDDGLPFDPTQNSPTDLSVPPDQRAVGGMGIVLLHTMTDALSYQRTDGHNILTLVKYIKD